MNRNAEKRINKRKYEKRKAKKYTYDKKRRKYKKKIVKGEEKHNRPTHTNQQGVEKIDKRK